MATRSTTDMTSESTDNETEVNFHPKVLMRQAGRDIPLKTRVIYAATVRNPDAGLYQLQHFTGIRAETIRSVGAAVYRDQLESRGMLSDSMENRGTPMENRTKLSDFTRKQQAIIKTLARYPSIMAQWPRAKVQSYISDEYGVEVSTTYPYEVKKDYGEFIKSLRATLESEGVDTSGLPDDPDIPGDDELRVMYESRPLPDENMDDLENPDSTWIEQYREADLDDDDAVERLESQTDVKPESKSESESDVITRKRGNSSYKGRATGLDATMTHLSEINADKATSKSEPEPKVEMETESDPDPGPAPNPYEDALRRVEKRVTGFQDVLKGEYEKHENEHTAARLNTVEWVHQAINEAIEDAEGE